MFSFIYEDQNSCEINLPDSYKYYAFAYLVRELVAIIDVVVDDIVEHSKEFVEYGLTLASDFPVHVLVAHDDNKRMDGTTMDCCVVLIIPFRRNVEHGLGLLLMLDSLQSVYVAALTLVTRWKISQFSN